MKDYNIAFQELARDAFNHGWRAVWLDLTEGNDIYFPDEDTSENVIRYFHFIAPEEMKG